MVVIVFLISLPPVPSMAALGWTNDAGLQELDGSTWLPTFGNLTIVGTTLDESGLPVFDESDLSVFDASGLPDVDVSGLPIPDDH